MTMTDEEINRRIRLLENDSRHFENQIDTLSNKLDAIAEHLGMEFDWQPNFKLVKRTEDTNA